MDRAAAQEWLEGYRQAWVNRDPAAAAALFSEDASYREAPYDEAFAGREGVSSYWARVTETQSAIELTYGEPLVDGDRVVVEWWCTLNNAGADITLAGALILSFDGDGLCRELREYWHFGEGRLTPPAGWGT